MLSKVDSYAKPWMIPINDKKNMIKLIKIVNNPCIDKTLCKASKDHLSFKSHGITRILYRYKRNMAPSPSKVLRRPWTWTKPHALGKTRESVIAFEEDEVGPLTVFYERARPRR